MSTINRSRANTLQNWMRALSQTSVYIFRLTDAFPVDCDVYERKIAE